MRKVDYGEKKKEKEKRKKKKEKNVVFSGHYVIASSRPLERRTLVPKVKKKNPHRGLPNQKKNPAAFLLVKIRNVIF